MKSLQIFTLLAVIQNVFTQVSKSNYGMFQTDREQPRGQVSDTGTYPDAIGGHNGQNDEYRQAQAASLVMARLGDNHNLKTAIKDRIADIEFGKSQGQENGNASGIGYDQHSNFTEQSQYSGQGTDFGQVRKDVLYPNVETPRGTVDTKFDAKQGGPGQSGDYGSFQSQVFESGHNAGTQQKQWPSLESHANQTRGIGDTGHPYANKSQNVGQGFGNENTNNQDLRYEGQSPQRGQLAIQESTNFEDQSGGNAGQGPQIEKWQNDNGSGTENVAYPSRNIQGQGSQEDQTTQQVYNNTNSGFQDFGVGNKITLENQSAKQSLGTSDVGYTDLGKGRDSPKESHSQPTRQDGGVIDNTGYQDAKQDLQVGQMDGRGLDTWNIRNLGVGKGGQNTQEQLSTEHGFGTSYLGYPGAHIDNKNPQGEHGINDLPKKLGNDTSDIGYAGLGVGEKVNTVWRGSSMENVGYQGTPTLQNGSQENRRGISDSSYQQLGIRRKFPEATHDQTLAQAYGSENTGYRSKSLGRDSQQGTLLGQGFGISDFKYPVEDVWAKVPHVLYKPSPYSDFTHPFIRAHKYGIGSVNGDYHRPKVSKSHFVKYGTDGSGYNGWDNIMFSHVTEYDPVSFYGVVGGDLGHGRKYTSFKSGYQMTYGDEKRIWSRNFRQMEIYRMCQDLSFLFRQEWCVPTMTFLHQVSY